MIMQEVIKGEPAFDALKGEGTLSSAWAKPGAETSIAGLLYLVQNNLQYVAVRYPRCCYIYGQLEQDWRGSGSLPALAQGGD